MYLYENQEGFILKFLLQFYSFGSLVLTFFLAICCSDVSRRLRKPTICICKTKSTYKLLKSEILTFQPSSVDAQAGLYRTWSEPKLLAI